MREAIRDIDRLHHILEQIDNLQALMPELSFWDTRTNDLPELRPFVVQYINELMGTK